ncbi:response regulator transcription factor [Pseudomonas aeruginosa]|uniref:response regulator transcription factor n=1 Tax=Pseudomonas aeruginosa TaxID=287 RepID=UPI00071B1CE2|nr:response regulator transcription factor [Pseudomonas aeruginosa]EKU3716855.1 response regulator transcription factor [Pseudomonas aeruginosa]KSF04245.1 helix-turn-helix domain-containing protein [Pseudomonas aeruginosa]MBG6660537.1 response regulator transcription factor [Pseudomonas aeruginosa]MBH4329554.1 response regulator transcription factor [Pseudomonas aeruginosa]MBI7049806.1 response regulator transcription factor [Pseudomonas aeruginosa]
MSHPHVSSSPSATESHPSTKLLSPAELEALNVRISANADKWLADNAPKTKSKTERKPKSNRGKKPKIIDNPFYGFIGCTTDWGRYPVFAENIIEGVARLDWHDRPIGVGGKSTPLSVRNLVVILESLPVVTNETVEDLLQLGERHARRYVKAIELIVPWMMKIRPQSLINEMDGIEPEPKACKWNDCDDACAPNIEELAKLHHDLRTLTEYKTAEEYETAYPIHPINANVVTLPTHHQHQRQNPKRQDVVRMLAQGMAVKAIERETGVSAKTIRKWRHELQTVQDKLQVA